MELKERLQAEIDKGFSKAELERLIGLTKNSLSNFLNNGTNFSKKMKAKATKFLDDNPNLNPFEIEIPKVEKKENSKSDDLSGKNVIIPAIKSQTTSIPYSNDSFAINRPKNMVELKKLMPEGLDSEGRSEWTRINRAKYGI
tara:strand:- start:5152 stop:5577 length:426 start_codon:yes stop_codon:yes gene_type:complete